MLNIIPTPKSAKIENGSLDISGLFVRAKGEVDGRVLSALSEFFKEAGISGGDIPLAVSHGDSGEGYALTVHPEGIEICAEGAAGAFWAVQTLRQLFRENGKTVPCCHIEDAPDLSYRGYYLDISRGRVPTLKKLKAVADTLAHYKINSLQLYVEDAFTFRELEGIVPPERVLTPEEILELDAYCKARFINLVPSMSTFGHLYTLLQSDRYNHICELRGHKPTRNYWLERQWHHTADPYNPETIQVIGSMLEQFIPLFSSKYFNICCDETMDLCGGVNSGRDKGEAYFHHVEKLIDIVKSHGKIPMMWGDEIMARPDMAKERLPRDVIVLNWCYRERVAEWIPKMFHERGFEQIACTGTSCWDSFIENIRVSCGNISSFAEHAKKYDAKGLLNTSWGDFGHVCPFNCNLYGTVFGAEKSWNTASEASADYERAASQLIYNVTEFNMADTLRRLAEAQSTCSWSDFVIWHSATHLENKEAELGFGFSPKGKNTAEDAKANAEICRKERERLENLGREDGIICDLILSARATELMNRLYLCINKADGCGDKEALQKDFNTWLEAYSTAWLRDDKPSDLWRLKEFIGNITK